jgi:Na+-translocating ferredoxin:NAD+ oxidoreductase RnfA subunit
VNFVDIVFASLFANNLLFFHYLGLGEFLGDGGAAHLVRRTLTLAVLLVLSSVLFWIPDHFLLQVFHLTALRTLLVLAILGLVTLVYSAVVPALPGTWPQARELLVHSLLVGGLFLVGPSSPDVLAVAVAALAVALGYGGALVLLVAVFRRVSRENLPAFIQGLPLQLLTLGLVWLVLQGLGFAFAGKGL